MISKRCTKILFNHYIDYKYLWSTREGGGGLLGGGSLPLGRGGSIRTGAGLLHTLYRHTIVQYIRMGQSRVRIPTSLLDALYIYRHTIVHIFEWGSQGFASRHPDVAIRRTKCKIPIYSNTEKGQKSTVTMQTNVKINTLDIRKLKMLFYPTFS